METNIYSHDPVVTEDGDLRSAHLKKLFEDELRCIFWAEKTIQRIMANMIEGSTSIDLKQTLQNHFGETKNHVNRLIKIFDMIALPCTPKKCEAMEGFFREGENAIQECEAGPMRDAGIISSAQKIEHFEIATYEILRLFAETLHLFDVAELLSQTLDEEKSSDKKLAEIVSSSVNTQTVNSTY